MKNKTVLLRFSEDEMATLMAAYKNRLIEGDYISRSEYIRKLIFGALENTGVRR